jgi:hypothetical protein
MSATNYTSKNILWSFITSLADGDFVSMARLYEEGLQRLHDGQGALLGRIAKVYADLSSTTIGTKARIVGNVDMTSFNYNSGIALSGLTVIVDEDTAAAQTVTFDNTVTGPSVLLAQLTAQAPTNLIWSLNDSGQLMAESQTAGAGSTIALGAGTAHGLIWPSPTITSPGGGAVNDGALRIGLAAFASWGGGNLRDFLVAFEAAANATSVAVATKVAKAGDTVTGLLAFSGASAQIQYRAPIELPDAASTTLTLNFDFATVPNVSQNSVYDIPDPTTAGRWFVVRRLVTGSGFAAAFRRIDTTTLGTLPDTGEGSLLFVSQSDGGSGFEWSAWPYGGNATAVA